jgi:hypothetical protein
MATSRTDRERPDQPAADGERAGSRRRDVIEILAGAVVSLVLQPKPGPPFEGPLRPPRALNSAISGQIRCSQ